MSDCNISTFTPVPETNTGDTEHVQVAIIGGGLAGLTCASTLARLGLSYKLIEAQPTLGGRIQTDAVDGFLLDRGFQVLLSSYEEAQMQLAWEDLELEAFDKGAILHTKEGNFYPMLDPTKHPTELLTTMQAPIGGFATWWRLMALRLRLAFSSEEALLREPEQTTQAYLEKQVFSQEAINRFFRPFFGGVFLETELTTSARKFKLLYRYFSQGDALIPAKGMQQIARQLAEQLEARNVWLNETVLPLEKARPICTKSGKALTADKIVLATDSTAAAHLLGLEPITAVHATDCWYFAGAQLPDSCRKALYLQETTEKAEAGAILHWSFPSLVQTSYAPKGQHLLSVTTVAPSALPAASETACVQSDADEQAQAILRQLQTWHGAGLNDWRFLRRYRISNALPTASFCMGKANWTPLKERAESMGVALCGDYTDVASINGAFRSGRLTALKLLKQLQV